MSGQLEAADGRRPRRVILKISGEGFCRAGERGIAMDAVVHLAEQTRRAAETGAEIAVVMGGGNILRGAQFTSVWPLRMARKFTLP